MATGFNTQVGNGEYRLQFETDNIEYYLLIQEAARRCVDGRQMTNADRIRAMSDEELSIFVRAVVIADGCPNGDVDCKECPLFAICNQSGLYGHEMEWLKQTTE